MRRDITTRLRGGPLGPPRRLLAPALVVACGLCALAAQGLMTFAFTDYEEEAYPAYSALIGGHVRDFFAHLPGYGGSLVLRAPFALAPALWGGGDLAVYRAVAVPCLAALGVLALVLDARMRAVGRGRWARLAVLLLVAANPVALRALEVGHPEELLGAALCVGAMLAAGAQRPVLAGVLVGLGVFNKPWALVALPVVVLATPRGARVTAMTAVVPAALLAPVVLLAQGGAARGVAAQTGAIFQPWQAWWFLGAHGHVVRGIYGLHVGYRSAPAWLSGIPHPLILLLSASASVAWRARRRAAPWHDALLLMALLLLARCILDPWNNVYYAEPFLMALLAWEIVRGARAPWLTLVSTLAVWVSFELAPDIVSPDATAALYLAWSIPLAAALALRLAAPRGFARPAKRAQALARTRMPTLSRVARLS